MEIFYLTNDMVYNLMKWKDTIPNLKPILLGEWIVMTMMIMQIKSVRLVDKGSNLSIAITLKNEEVQLTRSVEWIILFHNLTIFLPLFFLPHHLPSTQISTTNCSCLCIYSSDWLTSSCFPQFPPECLLINSPPMTLTLVPLESGFCHILLP